jgi:hypothetical protein
MEKEKETEYTYTLKFPINWQGAIVQAGSIPDYLAKAILKKKGPGVFATMVSKRKVSSKKD